MSVVAEWSERLGEYLDHEKTCDSLLRRGSKDWRLGTDYAFALAADSLTKQGQSVPAATRGLIIATVLSGIAVILGWALFLGLVAPSPFNIALSGATYLAFQFGFGRSLNALGLSDGLQNQLWLAVGVIFCGAAFFILPSETALRIGLTLIVLLTSLAALSCLVTWIRPDARFRFNLLEMTKESSSGFKRGTAFLLAMSNVANCVANLRKADRAGPEQFTQTRERYGATPGHSAYSSHPLGLTDRQFAADLEHLLAGTLPQAGDGDTA